MNIKPENFDYNIFNLIGKDWMLITAGTGQEINTMTASFGGFGVLFFKNVAHIYVRPERYTYEFIEKSDTFSLTFFDEQYKDVLRYCGKASGRDENKIQKSGLTVVYDDITPYFSEARIAVICRKLYRQDIQKECFTESSAYDRTYSTGGLHRMYIGEILNIIQK